MATLEFYRKLNSRARPRFTDKRLVGQRWEKKKLIYQIKLDLYSKFIESYQELVANPKDENLKQLVVASQKKLELIAPKSVIELSEKFYKATPSESVDVRNSLVRNMRRDLGNF